ncbi:MAG: VOC family protein [Chloroflexota bacterium]
MDLGEYTPCLKVADINSSIEFYEKLGFKLIEDFREENWAVLLHNNMVLSLYQEHIERNLINFRGGDIKAIEKEATANGIEFSKPATRHDDNSWSAEILDPDGNVIFFNTYPDEREKYVKTGKLVDGSEEK